MKKVSYPNIMLIVKAIAYPFFILAFTFYSTTIAGAIYLIAGLTSLASIYIVFRGVYLSSLQINTNNICDSIFNITALGVLVFAKTFSLVYLIIFVLLEFISTALSLMIVAQDYSKISKRKIFLLLEMLIWGCLLFNFFNAFEPFRLVLIILLLVVYAVEIVAKLIVYFSFPDVQEEIKNEAKDIPLDKKINNESAENEIVE